MHIVSGSQNQEQTYIWCCLLPPLLSESPWPIASLQQAESALPDGGAYQKLAELHYLVGGGHGPKFW